MKRLLSTALLLSLASPALSREAYDERQDAATNHGHYTAALEKVCPGMTVTNPKLRAKLDKQYRYNPRWKKYFQKQYNLIAGQYDPATGMDKRYPAGVWLTCLTARTGAKEWLTQDPAAVEQLEINKNKYEAAKRDKSEAAKRERLAAPIGATNAEMDKTVKFNMFACQDSGTFSKLFRLLHSNDDAAFSKMLDREMASKSCTMFRIGDAVRVDDRSVAQVCISNKGSIDDCYWTIMEVVK